MERWMPKVLPALVAVFFLQGCSSKPGQGGPSQAEIEKLLRKSFTNADYATRQYELNVESVTRGAARVGDQWADGTPANKKTEVFPCKVVWLRTATYTGGKTEVVKERFTGEYVFFRDEFGAWTFKLKEQESQKI